MKFTRNDLITLLLAGIVLPMVVWGWQRWVDSKSLSLTVVAESQMVVTGVDKAPEVKISVNGATLESPYVSYIRVSNNGGQPLTVDDFKTPVSLRLQSSSKLEHVRVSAQMPKDLNVQLVPSTN